MSSGIAAWIAQLAFWGLVLRGVISGDLGPMLTATFVILWLAGLLSLPHVPYGAALFPSFVAVLDVALVLIIFKGDVRLT